MSGEPGSNKPLPPLHAGFDKKNVQREAAAAEFGKQLASLDLDGLEVGGGEPTEPTPPAETPTPEASSASDPDAIDLPDADAVDLPNLEPVGDDAHPPQNRRMPTQPPSAFVLELDRDDDLPSAKPTKPKSEALPASSPEDSPSLRPSSADRPLDQRPPPNMSPRHSPAPLRRGLFSIDRVTNVLAGVAVGLLVTIFPAQKLAHSYEVREVEPLFADLEGAIDHPLGVEAGLVAAPETIAAQIHAGRKTVRRRYGLVWLLCGLPLGLGLAFAPRPGD